MPVSIHFSIVSMSRMPPPSCTGFDRLEDGIDRVVVHRLAREGAVEVDDVQVLETLLLEGARLGGRVVVEDRRLVHVAELEAHALPSLRSMAGKRITGGLAWRLSAGSLAKSRPA